jgi:hypothetical protein
LVVMLSVLLVVMPSVLLVVMSSVLRHNNQKNR